MKTALQAILFLVLASTAKAQISGYVFRDFNGNGLKDNTTATSVTAANIEPGIAGAVVKAFNSSDILIAQQTTGATGYYAFPVGTGINQIPNSTNVRLEYNLPENCVANSAYDFTAVGGNIYGSNVQFKSQSSTAIITNFAISNPANYRGNNNNPKVFIPRHTSGNPLAGSGNAPGQTAMYLFNYTASGNTLSGNQARTNMATASQIGACWGVAYNKYNDRIYTSAVVKRHAGLGPGGPSGSPNSLHAPGSIYIINPNTTNSGTFFFSMDALGSSYQTHSHTGGNALNVRDNAARGLLANVGSSSADAFALDQAGKVGIGDIELSDDGRYLWLTNLYDRKLYRIDLINPAAPVAPTAATAAATITSWNLPAISCTNGTLRPWGLKFHRGKVFVGAVCTGETETNANSTTNVNTNYNGSTVVGGSFNNGDAYVFQFNPSTTIWTTSINFSLNYPRGNTADENFDISRWYNWTSNFSTLKYVPTNNWGALIHAQPILSNLEFDVDGTMIIGFADRLGLQAGLDMPDPSGANSYYGEVGGDLLRAYNNGCAYQLEINGKEGSASSKNATTGTNTGQGPGSSAYGAGGSNYGEFYWDERFFYPVGNYWAHNETSLGNLTFLPGSDEIMEGIMDPLSIHANGTVHFNNSTGAGSSRYELVSSYETGTYGKGSTLGDIEIILPLSPIEVGNRVWNDANQNGIQDAGENGLPGVIIELYDVTGLILLGTNTTDVNGNFYFNQTNVTGGFQENTNYVIKISSIQFSSSIGVGLLNRMGLTLKNVVGSGLPGLSDNDADIILGRAQISFATGKYGQNNYNLDFGFYAIPLPLKLISFSAELNNNKAADLKWTTVAEENVKHFELEKSTDGNHYNTIGVILAKGVGATLSNYIYRDNLTNTLADIIYYRLRSVDNDGKFELSPTKIIKLLGNNNAEFKFGTFPNPFVSELKILIPNAFQSKDFTVSVISKEGKLNKKYHFSKPGQIVSLNVQYLSSGVYFLKIECEGEIFTQKIIKQKE